MASSEQLTAQSAESSHPTFRRAPLGRGAVRIVLSYALGVDERDWPEALDELIGAVPAAKDTYWAAVDVLGCATKTLTTSAVGCRLFHIWAGLTDWFELKPEERAEAVSAMSRAATQWLDVKDRPVGRDQYLDHWQYEVLGSER